MAEGLLAAEGSWAKGSMSPQDGGCSSHPRLPLIEAQRAAAGLQKAPTWAPADEPSSRGESTLLALRSGSSAKFAFAQSLVFNKIFPIPAPLR